MEMNCATRCRELKKRQLFPLRAIIACTPVNPTGKVFTKDELEDDCRRLSGI